MPEKVTRPVMGSTEYCADSEVVPMVPPLRSNAVPLAAPAPSKCNTPTLTSGPGSPQIARGTTQQFTATGAYNDGTTPDITALVSWKADQAGVATVSTSPGTQGLAFAQGPGSTTITASIGAISSPPSSLAVSNASLLSISVSPQGPSVGLASAQQLTATGNFDDGSMQDLSRDVAWDTAVHPSPILRISSAGQVTGLGLGSETVTATFPSSTITDSTSVTVDESSVATINVLPLPMVMFHGAISPQPFLVNDTGQQMRAVAVFQDGSSRDVTQVKGMVWSVADNTVATVNPDTGALATTGQGLTAIYASLGGKQGSTALNVGNARLSSLVVAPNGASIAQGGIQNVAAIATFLAADNLTLIQQDVSEQSSWSSDNPGVATIGELVGLEKIAQGLSVGTAHLSATFNPPGGSATSSAALNVTTSVLSAVNLAPASAAIPLDGGHQYAASGIFTDGTKQDMTLLAGWTSGNGSIAAVSSSGYADASGPGQTGITATIGGQTGSSSLLVNPGALSRIDICASTVANPLANCPPLDPFPPPPAITLANQTMFGLVAIGTFTDGSRQDLTDAVHWSSTDPGVATISNDPGIPGIATGVGRHGMLTGEVSGGTASITARAAGINSTATVEVTQASPQQLLINPANGIVPLGTPQQYTVTAVFSDGSKQDVTSSVRWNSLNADVAVVSAGGMAFTTGTGIANVSLTSSGLAVTSNLIMVTMSNPSTTDMFPWPIGSVFQFHGLTVSAGDVTALNDVPFTILTETDPTDSQHAQPCKPGQSCDIWFAPPVPPPVSGSYTVTAGYGQASALITATMDLIINSMLSQVSGSTVLTVH